MHISVKNVKFQDIESNRKEKTSLKVSKSISPRKIILSIIWNQ